MTENNKNVWVAGFGYVTPEEAAKVQAYKDFMYNPENSGCCSECPENIEMRHESGNPCGQYRCWVDAHCL